MDDLSQLELLRHFSPDDLHELEKATVLVECMDGEALRNAGSESSEIYIVKSGEVAIMRDGRVSNILKSGEIFWEAILFGKGGGFLEAVARTDVVAYAVDADFFVSFLRTYPTGATNFLLSALEQLTHRLYNSTQLVETVVELGSVASGMESVDDLPAEAARLIQQAFLHTSPNAGCAVFVWNLFDQSYDLLLREQTDLEAGLCEQFDATAEEEEEETYLQTPEGLVFGIRLNEGTEKLGIVFLTRPHMRRPFTRMEEFICRALARQLALLVHRHNVVEETVALRRLHSHSRWDL